MRYREFIEGIRMGARDLAAAPKKQYTIGLEFEVAVKDSYDRDFDPDSDDIDDEEIPIEELFDEFTDRWYRGESTFDFEEWFNEFIRYNDGLKTVIDHVEPNYGWVEIEDFIEYKELENSQRVGVQKMRYGAENVQKAEQFVELFPSEETLNKNTEQAKNLIRFVYNDIKNNSDYETDQEWQDLFDSMSNERLIRNAETALNTVRYIYNATRDIPAEANEADFEEERYIYGDRNKSIDKIVDIEEDISDTEDVLEYFDTDLEELRDITNQDWQDAENEEMMNAFDNWASNNRSGSTGKINYVKSLLKDIRKPDWMIVTDATQGVDAEIVTGVMDIDEGIRSIQQVFELIESNEYLYTDSSTGLHINIGTWKGNEWKSVDWLKFLIVYRADQTLIEFERQFNGFAKDRLPDIIQDLESNSLEAFYDNIDTVNKTVMNLSPPKNSAVNFKKLTKEDGSIEIRAPGGTNYHKKLQQVITQIRRAIRALEIASDPNSYKNQYIKKLHKMLSQQKDTAQGTTPAERFFREFGIRKYIGNDVLNIIKTAIKVSDRVDVNRINRLYNLSTHKQIVSDLKRVGSYTADESVGNDIRRELKKHDTNGRFAQSKFMKHILSAFPETAKPPIQNQPMMSSDEMKSLINKSS